MSMTIPFANPLGPNNGPAGDGVLFGVLPQMARAATGVPPNDRPCTIAMAGITPAGPCGESAGTESAAGRALIRRERYFSAWPAFEARNRPEPSRTDSPWRRGYLHFNTNR